MAEPKAYEPEELTARVTAMALMETEKKENFVRRLASGLCTLPRMARPGLWSRCRRTWSSGSC